VRHAFVARMCKQDKPRSGPRVQVNSGSLKLGCLRKDPMPICASEISNAKEAAIVCPNLLVHLHSNPFLESRRAKYNTQRDTTVHQL
jgi:hypothetical protein